uniref:SH3-domain binding protein 4 n=1 Tax=Eptatretus burgeri TaxID=7764 RepID=A0A8C4RAF1_EPTBU
MAASRIRANATTGLPRCRSEGTLIDLEDNVPELIITNSEAVPSRKSLLMDGGSLMKNTQEVVAVRDYCPDNFTALALQKGQHLHVLDKSRSEWWYAHNNKETGYIPAAYVRPVNSLTQAFSDSGMVDQGPDPEHQIQQKGLLYDWPETLDKPAKAANPYSSALSASNPFLNEISWATTPGKKANEEEFAPKSIGEESTKSSLDWLMFDPLRPDNNDCGNGNSSSTDMDFDLFNRPLKPKNPFLKSSNRWYSMSELSIRKEEEQAETKTDALSMFSGFQKLRIENFENNREEFRSEWLKQRQLARSCHDLGMIGTSPGWGQTQSLETQTVAKVASAGGAVPLPDTDIILHLPEGHVEEGFEQQVALKVLIEPPTELNNDSCTTVSPLLEINLGNTEVQRVLTLEMKISSTLRSDSAEIICMRSPLKDGPFKCIPMVCAYGSSIQAQIENPGPWTYIVAVARAPQVMPSLTIWHHICKNVTLGLYGPRHIHPSFTAVVAIFSHSYAPQTLLATDRGLPGKGGPPLSLQLWGKHEFSLNHPKDLHIQLFPSDSAVSVAQRDSSELIRSFRLKLGMVCKLAFLISSCGEDGDLEVFAMRVQVKDEHANLLTQFSVRTPQPAARPISKSGAPRRFVKKKEMGRVVLAPLTVQSRYPTFHDRLLPNLRSALVTKTVMRQQFHPYLLEYKKGDILALLSTERVRVRGHLRAKEWNIAFRDGRLGLVHCRNILDLGSEKRSGLAQCPQLSTATLLDQMLQPCKCLTYVYSDVRSQLMAHSLSWRAFADSLGYAGLSLSDFCRVEIESEAERVAAVLERLKEDCNSGSGQGKKAFQKELFKALLKMDCQGLVVRLLQDFVLLTTAVEVSTRWRELAERLAKATRQQMDAFEQPHRNKNGYIDDETMWKPAYDFLVTWSSKMGESYRDVVQELHMALEKMRNPITRHWRHLTGTLVLILCLDILRAAAFSPTRDDSTM